MTIPDYQSMMLPLLKFSGDKKEHSLHESIDHISNLFVLDGKAHVTDIQNSRQPRGNLCAT
jgi:restriction system protein